MSASTIALRRSATRAGTLTLATASVALTQLGATVAASVNTVTVTVLAWLLMRGARRHDALRRTRLLLLVALGTVFTAGMLDVLDQLVSGHAPPRPWVGDFVGLCYVPVAVAGLLTAPVRSQRRGHRVRALADGLIASTSLWYLLLAVGVGQGTQPAYSSGAARAVALLNPVGDVFVVAAALTVLARCATGARRMVMWIVAGLSVIAVNDTWLFGSGLTTGDRGPAMVYQVGLLLLIGGATAPAVERAEGSGRPPRFATLIGGAPFVPLLASMVATAHRIAHGRGLSLAQTVAALAVAVGLMWRQLAASRDKDRLVDQLTEREAWLASALRRDDLTGLPNRLALSEELDAALAEPSQGRVALALLDLDNFKLVTDNHGHAVGDAVLEAVARRLRRGVRAEDIVAHLGGDEFAVLTRARHDADLTPFATRLQDLLGTPVALEGLTHTVTASIGVVSAHADDTAGELLAHADAAMYRAKASKRRTGQHAVLDDTMRADIRRQLRIQESLAEPILEQFHLCYQPIVDLTDGAIVGIEGLLRWNHPELGAIPPDVFIPLAESNGTIGILGQHVLETAISDLARLRALRAHRPLVVAVNVSPRQLADPSFVGSVLTRLAAHGVDTAGLELEITEHAFEQDLAPVATALAQLTEAGIRVAVDDFGTGYSSLRYLQQLPLDVMKIDRSFVSEVTSDAASARLVHSVSTMAAGLGLEVVAEGIETAGQLRELRAARCALGQGYLFDRPLPFAAIEAMLEVDHAYPLQDYLRRPLAIVPQPREDVGAPEPGAEDGAPRRPVRHPR